MAAMPIEEAVLVDAARAARRFAVAPYSNFAVGAALETADGVVVTGCNVENASYPEGICAEASAIGAMVAAGETEIVEVLTIAGGELLTTCCGGCRQRIREFARSGTPVHAAGPDGVRRTFTIEPELLDRLRAIKVRTGLSESEQVRQGIRWWLESREWPARRTEPEHETPPSPPAALPARVRKRR